MIECANAERSEDAMYAVKLAGDLAQFFRIDDAVKLVPLGA